MNTKQKQLNLLGLAQRANALISGDELVEKAVKTKRVHLIIIASDVSEKTKARYLNIASNEQVPIFDTLDTIELSQALGKKRSICGLTETGFAKRFLSYSGGETIYE